ncbi:SDR family oxidoreductase [Mycobacterium sp. 236(2023)]|uniref:SDR family oxidoreductase n=1 Tax=Mycobacterium sp. 236(2023) TaxID=3038163 RepID=UPI0024154A6F|nr:SDR family oxidoreductase [Mycobacterium sp. 236(2023)]MDG4669243.1 SDR family oxidoreductase [Mycobacterium sp. 236(2023)]
MPLGDVAVVGAGDDVSSAVARRCGATVQDTAALLPAVLDGIVVVMGADAAPTSLESMDAREWRRLVDEPLWQTISLLQRAWTSMRDHGGRVVFVVPTIGMTGAPRFVPLTTVTEGTRALAKSAARQWADSGVIVNIVGVPMTLLIPGSADATQHLTAPAVADRSTLLDEVVETVAHLLRRDVRHRIGQTVIVDGGSVMLP